MRIFGFGISDDRMGWPLRVAAGFVAYVANLSTCLHPIPSSSVFFFLDDYPSSLKRNFPKRKEIHDPSYPPKDWELYFASQT
jgi:hypothetical protein